MNRNEFERGLATFGSDLDRWPDSEREAARALCAFDPLARRLLEDARRVDEAVLSAAHAPVNGALAAEIVAIATGRGEQAAFDFTPGAMAGVLAGSFGLAGIGYAAMAAFAALVMPVTYFDAVSAIVATGLAGTF